MIQLADLAGRLLRFEQQLAAYQKLHTDEMAELWQTLNECKREIVAALPSEDHDGHDALPMRDMDNGEVVKDPPDQPW